MLGGQARLRGDVEGGGGGGFARDAEDTKKQAPQAEMLSVLAHLQRKSSPRCLLAVALVLGMLVFLFGARSLRCPGPPSRSAYTIIPYYARSIYGESYTNAPQTTLLTQLSIDQIDRLLLLAEAWDGPMAAAVFIDPTLHHVSVVDAEAKLKKAYFDNIRLWHNLDVHLVVLKDGYHPKFAFPVNMLRNIAMENCRSRYAIHLDIDAAPSDGLFHHLTHHMPSIEEDYSTRRARNILAVPAFDTKTKTTNTGVNANANAKVAHTRREIEQHLQQGTAMYAKPAPNTSHTSIDYPQWQHVATGDLYTVGYTEGFVPYFAMLVDVTPMYDERLMDGEQARAAQMHALHRADVGIKVLGGGFLVRRDGQRSPMSTDDARAWEVCVLPENDAISPREHRFYVEGYDAVKRNKERVARAKAADHRLDAVLAVHA